MKYKVGDKVRVVIGNYYGGGDEGLVGKIVETPFGAMDGYAVEFDRRYEFTHDCGRVCPKRNGRYYEECNLELVSNKKIVITSDGAETLARLYEGDKVVKSATAKCSPDDEFDFSIGAKLALDRLMNTIKVGDKVEIVNSGQNYSTYAKWFEQNAPDLAVFYGYNYSAKNGTVGTVVRIAPHTYDKSETLYAIQEEDGVIRLMNEKGIKKVEG